MYYLLCIYFYAYDNFTNCSAMLNLRKPTIDLFIYYNIGASKLVNYETSKLKINVLNSVHFQKWCYTSYFCNFYLFIINNLKEENSDENHFFHAKVVLSISINYCQRVEIRYFSRCWWRPSEKYTCTRPLNEKILSEISSSC